MRTKREKMDNELFRIASVLHQEIESVYRQLSYLEESTCFMYKLIETMPMTAEMVTAKLYGDTQVIVSEDTIEKIKKLIKGDLTKKLKKLEKEFEDL
jgi:hypothetical protein